MKSAPESPATRTRLFQWLRRDRNVRSGKMLILRQMPQVSLPLTIALYLYLVMEAGLSIFFTLGTGFLVGSVPGALAGGFDSPAGRKMMAALIVTSAAFFMQNMLGSVIFVLTEAMARRINGKLRSRVMSAALRPTGIAHLEDPALLDKVALSQGIATGSFTPGMAVGGLFQSIIPSRIRTVAQAVLVGWYFSWLLAAAVLVTSLIVRSRLVHEFLKTVKVVTGQTRSLRRSDYFRDLALTPGAAKELRIFGLSNWILERFQKHWLVAMTDLWRERKQGSRTVLLWCIPALVATFGGLVLVGRAAVNGDIDLTSLAILIQAVLGAQEVGISQADLQVEYGAASVVPAVELEKLVAAPEVEFGGRDDLKELPNAQLSFEGVSFRDPGRDSDVFDGLDLVIPAGRSMAIVGANGAGKTTLVKLLSRLYEPTGGRIAIDGRNLRDFDPAKWQQRIAVIFQDFVRYELPAADNIGFGSIPKAKDHAALERAARRAGALGIIESLPQRWETILSREYKDGAELSGGQWQRIALARALFAVEGGAGILVLDEPTANLDVRAESEIFDQFLELTRGLTTILISHRFSTVRHADQICVLEGGKLRELGTHDELTRAGGLYAEMFRLQASRFIEEPVVVGGDGDA